MNFEVYAQSLAAPKTKMPNSNVFFPELIIIGVMHTLGYQIMRSIIWFTYLSSCCTSRYAPSTRWPPATRDNETAASSPYPDSHSSNKIIHIICTE